MVSHTAADNNTSAGFPRLKVALIGAGNVAWHLARVLPAVADVVQIAARSRESAARIADGLSSSDHRCDAIGNLPRLRPDCDLYIIAAKDDAVETIAQSTPDFPGIWVHTSGSVPVDALACKSRRGVFYPLQTFSRGVPVDFSQVPMLIEGSDDATRATLLRIAGQIAGDVRAVGSEAREAIHVAAVFACNFANLMWADADRLLRDAGLDISIMRPLLQATLDKLDKKTPADAMTGPARRGDIGVIARHLQSLPPDLREVYALLTDNIRNLYNEQDTLRSETD